MTLLSNDIATSLAGAAEMVKRMLAKKAGRDVEIVVIALKGDDVRLAATVPMDVVRERLPHAIADCGDVA